MTTTEKLQRLTLPQRTTMADLNLRPIDVRRFEGDGTVVLVRRLSTETVLVRISCGGGLK